LKGLANVAQEPSGGLQKSLQLFISIMEGLRADILRAGPRHCQIFLTYVFDARSSHIQLGRAQVGDDMFPYMNVRSTLNVCTLQICWKHETSRAATEPLWSSTFVAASLLATPRGRFVMFLRVSHRESLHRFQNGTDR